MYMVLKHYIMTSKHHVMISKHNDIRTFVLCKCNIYMCMCACGRVLELSNKSMANRHTHIDGTVISSATDELKYEQRNQNILC